MALEDGGLDESVRLWVRWVCGSIKARSIWYLDESVAYAGKQEEEGDGQREELHASITYIGKRRKKKKKTTMMHREK
uniref:Uncharacterized protein n=1 Tax=Manihot esculenta TaxID=3983 RepID=A0A2C9UMP9_MANES